jgi:NAD(P)H-hydrate epimerase
MDNIAITDYNILGIVLMENAGRNTAESVIEKCDEFAIDSVIVFAGKGNNGGDGFVIARYLDKNDIDVVVYLAADENDIKGDAKTNLLICQKSNIPVIPINNISGLKITDCNTLIVDALLGTGVKEAVQGFYAEIINWINDQDCYVFAVDIPSGANGDSIGVNSPVVQADFTCTMGLPKLSSFFYPLRSYMGELEIIDIGFPPELELSQEIQIHAVEEEDIILEYADPAIHKHKAGHVFILGGSDGMTGAVTLGAKGASIAGAGLVIAATARSLNPILENKLTEQITLGLAEIENGLISEDAWPVISEKLAWCDVLLIGPGFGRKDSTGKIILKSIEKAIQLDKKIIIDADALYFLAQNKPLLNNLNQKCVITPHHGEFSQFDPAIKEGLKSKPWKILADFNAQYSCVVNLKGAPSMAGHATSGIFINTTGNPGLAKGGSGDLLAGLIAGMAATGLEVLDATIYSNFIHGLAADNARQKWGVRSFSMENLMDEVKVVFNNFYSGS